MESRCNEGSSDSMRQSGTSPGFQRSFQSMLLPLEGGAVNQIQRGQIEEEYHRSRLRALRLDTDYRDSLDQLTSRFRISEERRRQMEDAALSPLTTVFQRFEEFSRDSEAAFIKTLERGRAENVAKVRPAMIKILTESNWVKNTTLPKRFLKHWDEWKKIDDKNKLLERIRKIREDLARLREREVELVEKQRKLPDADRQRMEVLKFEVDLGEFQLGLVLYEKQPWKDTDDNVERIKNQREAFFDLIGTFRMLLDEAWIERFNRLVQSWPGLASVKIKNVDLLACKRDEAEKTVSSLLKTPDAQRTGRKKIRRLHALAESYRIQQQLFRLSFQQREAIKDKIASPPSTHFEPLPGLPLLVVNHQADKHFGLPTLPEAIRGFSQVRPQLLQTWIDYQIVRLDLYSDLGVAPPEQ